MFLPLLPLTTSQLTLHFQESNWSWSAWHVAQVTKLFPWLPASTKATNNMTITNPTVILPIFSCFLLSLLGFDSLKMSRLVSSQNMITLDLSSMMFYVSFLPYQITQKHAYVHCDPRSGYDFRARIKCKPILGVNVRSYPQIASEHWFHCSAERTL